MISLYVWDDERKLAEVRLDFLYQIGLDEARYSVQVVTDRGDAIGLHQTTVTYNFRQHNVLGLIRLALDALSPESFDCEDEHPSPPDMARRQPRVVREIQARKGRLRDYRPAFWGRQSEQSSGDEGGEGIRSEDRQ